MNESPVTSIFFSPKSILLETLAAHTMLQAFCSRFNVPHFSGILRKPEININRLCSACAQFENPFPIQMNVNCKWKREKKKLLEIYCSQIHMFIMKATFFSSILTPKNPLKPT
jgi:hypothetical protein